MLTQTHNFSNQHIGAIKNNRNNISSHDNVTIRMTGKRYGNFQEIEIVGFSKDIRKALSALNRVASKADEDFKEYKERVSKRLGARKVSKTVSSPPGPKPKPKPKPKTNINRFALLTVDESDHDDQEDSSSDSGEDFEEISEIKLNWGDM